MRQIIESTGKFLLLILVLACPVSSIAASWRSIGPDAPAIFRLQPDRRNPGTWYTVTAGRFYGSFQIHETTDGGKTWKDIAPEFPADVRGKQNLTEVYTVFDSPFTRILVGTARGFA